MIFNPLRSTSIKVVSILFHIVLFWAHSNKIGIADMDVIPAAWLEQHKVSGFTLIWGWGFYVFVAAGFWLATIGVIWFTVTESV